MAQGDSPAIPRPLKNAGDAKPCCRNHRRPVHYSGYQTPRSSDRRVQIAYLRLFLSFAISFALHLVVIAITGFTLPVSPSFQPRMQIEVILPQRLEPQDATTVSLAANPEDSSLNAPHIKTLSDENSARISKAQTSNQLYIAAKELTRKPEPLADWEMLGWKLPPQSGGRVRMKLFISLEGRVDKIEFLDPVTNELHHWFQNHLMAGIQFSPGQVEGISVPSFLTVEINLAPLNR